MPRRSRDIRTGIGTVAAGLLASSALSVPWTAGAAPVADDTGPIESSVAAGAYLHYGPPGVERIAELSRWLGGRELRVGHTYLPGDRWSNIEGQVDFLRPWAQWRQGAQNRMFVLNVPMLERNEAGLPDAAVRALLLVGAQGGFDQHFRTLATRLVELGATDTVIVLGWEMNGITYTHRCAPDPEAWKTYWRRIVTAMRSVPGQQFRFDFAPNRGLDAIPWTQCYPGDDVVDIIGMDSYDQPPGGTFDEQVTAPYGLRHQVDFARAHNKRISYPEWGLFRNGDNPEYMRRMLEWIDLHEPLYQTVTDYCPHGIWQCQENPESSKVFRSKMSADALPVEPDPTQSAPQEPAPTGPGPLPDNDPSGQPAPGGGNTTNQVEWCLPAELGDWVAEWVGHQQTCVDVPWLRPTF